MDKEISRSHKQLSRWYPQQIRHGSSLRHPYLEVMLYKGRYQLGTPDALYSDGDQYWPARQAAAFWKAQSLPLEKVTVLGAGLASLVHVLEGQGFRPSYTLVDYDSLILDWAQDFYPASAKSRTAFLVAEAREYLEEMEGEGSQTLVFVDLFDGIEAWPGIYDIEILKKIRGLIKPGGGFILNYLVRDPQKWDRLQRACEQVFPGATWEQNHQNRLLTAIV